MLVTGYVTVCAAADDPTPPAPGAAVRSQPNESALTTVRPQRGRSVDTERDPGRGPQPTDPVFLDRATTETEHFRAGLSGWITPSAPFDHREDPGGAAIGLTITWPPPRHDLTTSGPNAWHGAASR
jgi:hypothetical protein